MFAADIHRSVLLEECMEYLAPAPGKVYVDGTLGMGGHSEAILRKSSPDGRLIAFEWDEKAIELSSKRLEPFEGRFTIVRRNFAQLVEGLEDVGVEAVDGILIDIGLSSLQLDLGERGFSFQKDEFLDMRMDLRRSETAASLLASGSEEELADIFYYYGEERQARPIAAAIVARRKKERIETTAQLVEVVSGAVPKRFHPKKIHVATKVFQALRIAVNTELENLATILDRALPVMQPGASLCVISFHSLEDRIVKRKLRDNPGWEIVTNKPVIPGEAEIKENPRSRSARLRVARRKKS